MLVEVVHLFLFKISEQNGWITFQVFAKKNPNFKPIPDILMSKKSLRFIP